MTLSCMCAASQSALMSGLNISDFPAAFTDTLHFGKRCACGELCRNFTNNAVAVIDLKWGGLAQLHKTAAFICC